MALQEFLQELESLLQEATEAFNVATDSSSLEESRIEFVGAKQGRLKNVQKGLGKVDKTDKPVAGKSFNETKNAIEAAYQTAKERLESGTASDDHLLPVDPTLPGIVPRIGHLHPLTQTIEEIKEIMGRLGFTVTEGPEVEDRYHNFEALNIPREHPARDPLDNFYLKTAESASASKEARSKEGLHLLRSQTSTVQIRVMENQEPPVRIVSLGRVYRPDTPDATHVPMFHQIEGLMIDKDVTMADLKSVLRLFGMSYFEDDVHIRFRPSFFPFTEPSVEMDMTWGDGWVEMGGAGMVDPNVLRSVGYDPEVYSGFAFGLGIERMCARKHGITDIREFYKNDIRFLEQF